MSSVFDRLNAQLHDGDTLKLDDVSHRMAGGDAPELATPKGALALDALDRILTGIEETGETDTKYDRSISRFQADDADAAVELAKAGLATPGSDQAFFGALAGQLAREQGGSIADPRIRDLEQQGADMPNVLGALDTRLKDRRGDFSRALDRGTDQTQAMLYAAGDAALGAAGLDAGRESMKEGILRNMEEASLSPERVGTYKNIEDVDTAVTYAVEALGENALTMVPTIIAGVLGAGVGAAAVQGGARAALTQAGKAAAKRELVKKFGTEEAARLAVQQSIKTGAMAGAFTGSMPLTTGETQQQLLEAGIDSPWTAIGAGALKAGLEVAPTLNFLGDVAKAANVDRAIMREVTQMAADTAKAVGKQAGLEGLTEGLQTVIDQTAVKSHTNEDWDAKDFDELLDAALSGAIVGGTMGAGAQALDIGGELASRRQKPDATVPPVNAPPTGGDPAYISQFPDTQPPAQPAVAGPLDQLDATLSPETQAQIDSLSAEIDGLDSLPFDDTNSVGTEPQPQVDAQLQALADPATGKDTVYLRDGQEHDAALIPAGASTLPTEGGAVVTTNPEVVAAAEAGALDSDAIGAALGYPETKTEVIEQAQNGATPVSIEITNPQGQPVTQAVATQERLGEWQEAAEAQFGAGSTVTEIDPASVERNGAPIGEQVAAPAAGEFVRSLRTGAKSDEAAAAKLYRMLNETPEQVPQAIRARVRELFDGKKRQAPSYKRLGHDESTMQTDGIYGWLQKYGTNLPSQDALMNESDTAISARVERALRALPAKQRQVAERELMPLALKKVVGSRRALPDPDAPRSQVVTKAQLRNVGRPPMELFREAMLEHLAARDATKSSTPRSKRELNLIAKLRADTLSVAEAEELASLSRIKGRTGFIYGEDTETAPIGSGMRLREHVLPVYREFLNSEFEAKQQRFDGPAGAQDAMDAATSIDALQPAAVDDDLGADDTSAEAAEIAEATPDQTELLAQLEQALGHRVDDIDAQHVERDQLLDVTDEQMTAALSAVDLPFDALQAVASQPNSLSRAQALVAERDPQLAAAFGKWARAAVRSRTADVSPSQRLRDFTARMAQDGVLFGARNATELRRFVELAVSQRADNAALVYSALSNAAGLQVWDTVYREAVAAVRERAKQTVGTKETLEQEVDALVNQRRGRRATGFFALTHRGSNALQKAKAAEALKAIRSGEQNFQAAGHFASFASEWVAQPGRSSRVGGGRVADNTDWIDARLRAAMTSANRKDTTRVKNAAEVVQASLDGTPVELHLPSLFAPVFSEVYGGVSTIDAVNVGNAETRDTFDKPDNVDHPETGFRETSQRTYDTEVEVIPQAPMEQLARAVENVLAHVATSESATPVSLRALSGEAIIGYTPEGRAIRVNELAEHRGDVRRELDALYALRDAQAANLPEIDLMQARYFALAKAFFDSLRAQTKKGRSTIQLAGGVQQLSEANIEKWADLVRRHIESFTDSSFEKLTPTEKGNLKAIQDEMARVIRIDEDGNVRTIDASGGFGFGFGVTYGPYALDSRLHNLRLNQKADRAMALNTTADDQWTYERREPTGPAQAGGFEREFEVRDLQTKPLNDAGRKQRLYLRGGKEQAVGDNALAPRVADARTRSERQAAEKSADEAHRAHLTQLPEAPAPGAVVTETAERFWPQQDTAAVKAVTLEDVQRLFVDILGGRAAATLVRTKADMLRQLAGPFATPENREMVTDGFELSGGNEAFVVVLMGTVDGVYTAKPVIYVPGGKAVLGERALELAHEMGHLFWLRTLGNAQVHYDRATREVVVDGVSDPTMAALAKDAAEAWYDATQAKVSFHEWAADQVAHYAINPPRNSEAAKLRKDAGAARIFEAIGATIRKVVDLLMRRFGRNTESARRNDRMMELISSVLSSGVAPQSLDAHARFFMAGGASAQAANAAKRAGSKVADVLSASTNWLRGAITRVEKYDAELAAHLYRSVGRAGTDDWYHTHRAEFDRYVGQFGAMFPGSKQLEAAYAAYLDGQATPDAVRLREFIDGVKRQYLSRVPMSDKAANQFLDDPVELFDMHAINTKTEAFKQLLVQHRVKDADKVIEAAIASQGFLDFDLTPHGVGATNLTMRELRRNANLMRELRANGFMQRDPFITFTQFIGGATQKGVFAEKFGGTMQINGRDVFDAGLRLNRRMRALEAKLAPAQFEELNKAVGAVLGVYGQNVNPTWRAVQTSAVAFNTYTLLAFSGLASIPDLGMPLVRSRSVRTGLKGMFDGIKMMANQDGRSALRMVGALHRSFVGTTMMWQNDMGNANRLTRRLSHLFFTANLNNFVTGLSRSIGVMTGREFLFTHMDGALAGDARAKRYLAEVGITAEQVKAYVDRYGRDNIAPASDEVTAIFDRAVSTFMYGGTMHPNNAMVPLLMSDARFLIFTNLKKFFWVAYENLVKSNYREYQARVAETGGHDSVMKWVAAQPMALAPVAMTFVPLMLLAALGYELRDKVKNLGADRPSPKLDFGQDGYWLEVIRRTGAMGPMELALNAAETGKSDSKTAAASLLGPSVQLFEQAVMATADFAADGDMNDQRQRALIKRVTPVIGQFNGAFEAIYD